LFDESYESSGKSMANIEYVQIIDEIMVIGSEKLLLTLGVPAEQGRPLNCGDVSILDMAVAGSWNGESIGRRLITSPEAAGHAPQYVISDNASTISKGVRCAQFKSAIPRACIWKGHTGKHPTSRNISN
jgi:hypothetical protein